MSLRIRDRGGLVIDLDQAYKFIEITDLDGNIGKLIFQDDNGVIREVVANSPEAERYIEIFKAKGIKFVPIIRAKAPR